MLRSILTGSRHLALAGAALVIGACASTPDVYTNVDRNADFTQYKTYGFFDQLATDRAGYESTETRLLKSFVAREMENRNFISADMPDLKINFYIETEEKIRSRQTPTTGGYYGGGYYGYRGYGAWGGYETRIDQYTQGTLNIDVVDVRTKQLVWEGALVGKITKEVMENLESALDQAVAEIYKSFPVPPKAPIPTTVQ